MTLNLAVSKALILGGELRVNGEIRERFCKTHPQGEMYNADQSTYFSELDSSRLALLPGRKMSLERIIAALPRTPVSLRWPAHPNAPSRSPEDGRERG